jgi:hypothetical protein
MEAGAAIETETCDTIADGLYPDAVVANVDDPEIGG